MKSFLITQTDPTYGDKSTMGKERQKLEQGSHRPRHSWESQSRRKGKGAILESPENGVQPAPQFQTSDPKACESTNCYWFKAPNLSICSSSLRKLV